MKKFAAVLFIICIIFTGCGKEKPAPVNTGSEFHTTVPVGKVPAEFEKIVGENLFSGYDYYAGDDRVARLYESGNGKYDFTVYDFYGSELYKTSLEKTPYHHVDDYAVTSDGGLIVSLGFSDRYVYDLKKYASEITRAVSYVIKIDKSGDVEWERELNGHERDSLCGIVEQCEYYYFFGTIETPETNVPGVWNYTDIIITKLDKSGKVIKTRTIAGSDFDEVYTDTVRYENGRFYFNGYSQSTDGDFSGKGGKERGITEYKFVIDENLDVISIKKTNDNINIGPFIGKRSLGVLSGKEIFGDDKLFDDFCDGTPTGVLDYGEFYLIISENTTGIYEYTPIYISAIWCNTETVYAAYDKAGKILWKAAVDSTNWPKTLLYGTYSRKNEEFGGLDEFSITLNQDSTFSYYETMISSRFGLGNYTFEDGIVTLRDGDKKFRFRYYLNALEYIAEESDEFTYIKLADGEIFNYKTTENDDK